MAFNYECLALNFANLFKHIFIENTLRTDYLIPNLVEMNTIIRSMYTYLYVCILNLGIVLCNKIKNKI